MSSDIDIFEECRLVIFRLSLILVFSDVPSRLDFTLVGISQKGCCVLFSASYQEAHDDYLCFSTVKLLFSPLSLVNILWRDTLSLYRYRYRYIYIDIYISSSPQTFAHQFQHSLMILEVAKW